MSDPTRIVITKKKVFIDGEEVRASRVVIQCLPGELPYVKVEVFRPSASMPHKGILMRCEELEVTCK